MQSPQVRRAVLFSLIALCICVEIWQQRIRPKYDATLPFGRTGLPSQGILDNPTGQMPPAGINKAMADGAKISHLVGLYRQLHQGSYPDSGSTFLESIYNQWKDYGFKSSAEAQQAFINPDTANADMPIWRQYPTSIPWFICEKRPDGTLLGSKPTIPGEDLIAYSPLYYHENIRRFNGSKDTIHPTGFFIVVWGDGQVEQIPFEAVRYSQVTDMPGDWVKVFPQESGTAPQTETYDQFYQGIPRQ